MKWSIQVLVLCASLGLFMMSVFFSSRTYSEYSERNNFTTSRPIHSKETQILQPQFVLIVCHKGKDTDTKVMADSDQHFREIKVFLKSAALLTNTTLKFHILSNSEDLYKQIINIPTEWPSEYRQRIVFGNYTEVYYPPEFKHIQTMAHLCASARLFLLHTYANQDAVVYIDVDTIFMQPPEDLWKEFDNFETRQIVGITPHLSMYSPPFKRFPVFGFSGINAGIMLMNLTRIRSFSKGWVSSFKDILDKYTRSKLPYGEQDMINIMFSEGNMVYAYELPCKWNYRAEVCSGMRNMCPSAASEGAALIHGAGKKFFSTTREQKIKALFQAWEKYNLGSPVQDLLSLLEESLQQARPMKCGLLSNLNDIFLKGLKRHLKV